MSNDTIKKVLIPIGIVLLFSCLACMCCVIVYAFGILEFEDSPIIDTKNPQDIGGDISQTSDYEEEDEEIPIEEFAINNQYELTQRLTNAMLQSALDEEEFIEVANWAYEMGIVDLYDAQPCCGAVTEYNDGGSLSGVVVGDIQVLNISGQDGSGYILSRFEGSEENPKWILFNQDGYVEISKDGIFVREDNGSASNNVLLASNSQFGPVNIATKNTCTNGGFTAFKDAIEKKHGGFWKASSACGLAIAGGALACATAPSGVTVPTCLLAVGVIGHTCGFPIDDGLVALIHDKPPKISLGEWIPTTSTTWRPWPKDDNVGGEEGEILVPIYRAKTTLTDDRKPDPTLGPADFIKDGYIELAAGSSTSVVITDCGGNWLEKNISAPEPRPEQLKTWRPSTEEIVDTDINLTEGEWKGKFAYYPFPSECKNPESLVNGVTIQISEKGVEGGGILQLHCTGNPTTSETGPLITYFIHMEDFSPGKGNGFVSETDWRGSVKLSQTGNCCPPFAKVQTCEIKGTSSEVTLSITIPDSNEQALVSLEKK
ncbi:hypothetical protein ACFLV7_00835 [Chloroflexota bacterium]